MRCPLESQENLELLIDYGLSGGKTGPLAAAFLKHLQTCVACRDAVAGQQQVQAALDLWEAPDVPLSFNRQLYRRIEEPVKWSERLQEAISASLRGLLVWKGVPLAATAGLVLMAGIMLQHSQSSSSAGSVAVEAAPPEQVLHVLDEIEMLDAFDQSVPPPGKSQL